MIRRARLARPRDNLTLDFFTPVQQRQVVTPGTVRAPVDTRTVRAGRGAGLAVVYHEAAAFHNTR